MKRFLFAVITISAIVLTGCEKDNHSLSLSGTTWEGSDESGTELLIFKNQTECESKYQMHGSVFSVNVVYTYEYDHPIVMMYPHNEGFAIIRGTIDGRTMSQFNTSTKEASMSLKRK